MLGGGGAEWSGGSVRKTNWCVYVYEGKKNNCCFVFQSVGREQNVPLVQEVGQSSLAQTVLSFTWIIHLLFLSPSTGLPTIPISQSTTPLLAQSTINPLLTQKEDHFTTDPFLIHFRSIPDSTGISQVTPIGHS